MKSRILNFSLILSSLIGYLEWGKDKKIFLFQAEAEIISKLFSDPMAVIHPFTLLPLAGQILLFLTLFQKNQNRILTFTAIAAIGILFVFMFVIGLIGLHYKILFSTLPFLTLAGLTINHHRGHRKNW